MTVHAAYGSVVTDDVNTFNARLKEWQGYYNFDRPRGGVDGQTPYEGSNRSHEASSGV